MTYSASRDRCAVYDESDSERIKNPGRYWFGFLCILCRRRRYRRCYKSLKRACCLSRTDVRPARGRVSRGCGRNCTLFQEQNPSLFNGCQRACPLRRMIFNRLNSIVRMTTRALVNRENGED